MKHLQFNQFVSNKETINEGLSDQQVTSADMRMDRPPVTNSYEHGDTLLRSLQDPNNKDRIKAVLSTVNPNIEKHSKNYTIALQ